MRKIHGYNGAKRGISAVVARRSFGEVSVIYRVSIVYLTCIYRIYYVFGQGNTREFLSKNYEKFVYMGKME